MAACVAKGPRSSLCPIMCWRISDMHPQATAVVGDACHALAQGHPEHGGARSHPTAKDLLSLNNLLDTSVRADLMSGKLELSQWPTCK